MSEDYLGRPIVELEAAGLIALADIIKKCPDKETARNAIHQLMEKTLVVYSSPDTRRQYEHEVRENIFGHEISNLIRGLMILATADSISTSVRSSLFRIRYLREMVVAIYDSKSAKAITSTLAYSWLPKEAQTIIVNQLVSDLKEAKTVEEFMELWQGVCFMLLRGMLYHDPLKALELALRELLVDDDHKASHHRPIGLDLAALGLMTAELADQANGSYALNALGKLIINAMAIHMTKHERSQTAMFAALQGLCVATKGSTYGSITFESKR